MQVVREARAAGRSWSQIAAALETSTAIARQRWGPPRQGTEHVEPKGSVELAVQTCGEPECQLMQAPGAPVRRLGPVDHLGDVVVACSAATGPC